MKKIFFILLLITIISLSGCVQNKEVEIEEIPEPISEAPVETQVTEPETIVESLEEAPTDPSLIAYWKFDEDARDSAGDYDGAIKGDAEFSAGKIGNALYLDGVDDYVDLPQSAVSKIGSLGQGTIAFWFKFTSILDKQTVMPIFYIGGNERDKDNIFIIELGHFDERTAGALAPNNKKLYVTWIKDNKDPFLCYDSNANLEEGKWHHFAAVVGPDGNTGYLNGAELKNRHYNFGTSKNPSFLDDILKNEKLMLGYGRSAYMVGPDFVYYKGALDDFRIYDKTLSAGEVKELFDGFLK